MNALLTLRSKITLQLWFLYFFCRNTIGNENTFNSFDSFIYFLLLPFSHIIFYTKIEFFTNFGRQQNTIIFLTHYIFFLFTLHFTLPFDQNNKQRGKKRRRKTINFNCSNLFYYFLFDFIFNNWNEIVFQMKKS